MKQAKWYLLASSLLLVVSMVVIANAGDDVDMGTSRDFIREVANPFLEQIQLPAGVATTELVIQNSAEIEDLKARIATLEKMLNVEIASK